MDPNASRPAPRLAVRALAWAALPVFLVAGCSSDSGDDTTDDEPAPSASPTPEPVRFAALPEPCSTLGEDTVGDIVPEADPAAGETLSSSDTSTSGACLWSGLDDYQFRSLTVALRRFDSDVTIGSGDERAEEYLRQMSDEVTGDEANRDVEAADLGDTGESAVTIAYTVTKETEEEGEQDYRQHRVAARTGNVVVTVDYAGAGFEGDDMPGADTVREAAEAAAREAVAAVDASENAEGGAGDGQEQGGEEGREEGGAGEDEAGDEPPSTDDV
ncbi:DUF3558 domain-containing protein [Streptomyces marincola]|uniref:DUF3558 domain-containing protein n=1 Tax=Streptomyces marincola TaxID=2878388 RepID=UPI001CF21524|nr:DUF3558 domain-containing protein [Streptomyces marincola]UCM89559.1 DUF3558 domain-containing protein [Streptomyces marincola]